MGGGCEIHYSVCGYGCTYVLFEMACYCGAEPSGKSAFSKPPTQVKDGSERNMNFICCTSQIVTLENTTPVSVRPEVED